MTIYDGFDWLAYEREKQEREEYVAGLFNPLFHTQGLFKHKWLIHGLLPLGSLCLIAGKPKVGKTSFATALALSVANGIDFAGMPTEQGAVLWIAAEESPQERTDLLEKSPVADFSTPFYTCFQPLQIDEQDSLDALEFWIAHVGAKLIVVDPLLGAVRGRSLRDSWNARRALQKLKHFCTLHRVTAIVLHHDKHDRFRRCHAVADNDQLAATASMSIVLSSTASTGYHAPLETERALDRLAAEIEAHEPHEDDPAKILREPRARIVRLECQGRGEWANRTHFLYSEGPLDYRPTIATRITRLATKPLTSSERKLLLALWQADGPMDSADLIDASGIPEGTARNALTNLRRRTFVRIAQVQNGIRLYEWTREGLRALDQWEPSHHPAQPVVPSEQPAPALTNPH